MIAEGGGKQGIERFHSRSDGNGIKAATQHPGAFGCILQAFPAGEAGRKHHAPDAICPERINGNGSGKSAVDAARQTQDDSGKAIAVHRSEEQTSELQSLMRISYAVFCLQKKTKQNQLQARNSNKQLLY